MTSSRYVGLADKAVLVTGGASGIGAGLVEAFANQGCRVGFLDVADAAAEALIADLSARSKASHEPLYRHCDITDIDALENAVRSLEERLGPVRILVNNAGSDTRHNFRDVDSAYWDDRLAINLKQQFFCAKFVHDGMAAAGGGSIINLSSTTWVMGEGGYVCYTTSKAGIYGMTRSLARDFGPAGIRVNAILPGWIITPRQKELWLDEEGERQIMERQALKDFLLPEHVAGMALFLASDDSRMITGQGMIVDGGWS